VKGKKPFGVDTRSGSDNFTARAKVVEARFVGFGWRRLCGGGGIGGRILFCFLVEKWDWHCDMMLVFEMVWYAVRTGGKWEVFYSLVMS